MVRAVIRIWEYFGAQRDLYVDLVEADLLSMQGVLIYTRSWATEIDKLEG